MSRRMVIVGGGQAGLQAAESLRHHGFEDEILLLGEESEPPYQRPPLSKQVLLGAMADAQVQFRSAEFYETKRITLKTGVKATALDRAAGTLATEAGETIAYDGLVLATGARVRVPALPGIELGGVHYLRSLEDCRELRAALAAASRVVVIGGGFIGLEVAAAARKLGHEVLVLEALDRLMARAVSPVISEAFARLHREQGTKLDLESSVSALLGEHGRVTGVVALDGTVHTADLVVIGIGVIPNDDLAAAAGIACERGIVVDHCARTSDPRVTAAGDCTARRLETGACLRLESVQNAIEQGKAAAASLLGLDEPFTATPWFWSHQYDVMLQMAGLSAGHDRIVVRGDTSALKFSAFYFREDRLIAVDSVHRPQDHMIARRLLDRGLSPTPEQAGDDGFSLKTLLA